MLPRQELVILPDHEESLETCDGCAMALAQALKVPCDSRKSVKGS
jgi:hypothetical protein